MELGKLIVRGTVGTLFIGHGMQKLNGAFGGQGLEGTGTSFERLGLRPGREQALTAGVAEAGGGALLLAGLATPAAVAALSGSMITAIRTVHLKNGPWVSKGGYEYNAVLLATLFSLAESGPGRLSLDAALGRERRGTRWALAALGAGAIGSYLATRYAALQAARAAEAAEEQVEEASTPAPMDAARDGTAEPAVHATAG